MTSLARQSYTWDRMKVRRQDREAWKQIDQSTEHCFVDTQLAYEACYGKPGDSP